MWTQQASAKKTDEAPQAQTPGSAAPGRPEERRMVAWVGKLVVFKGELSSAEDLTLDGHVEGSINVKDHVVTIGPDADIRADIVAKSVIVRGKVKGKIVASEKIHLYDTASVEGACKSLRFVIAEGAYVAGQVETLKQPTEARPQPRGPVKV